MTGTFLLKYSQILHGLHWSLVKVIASEKGTILLFLKFSWLNTFNSEIWKHIFVTVPQVYQHFKVTQHNTSYDFGMPGDLLSSAAVHSSLLYHIYLIWMHLKNTQCVCLKSIFVFLWIIRWFYCIQYVTHIWCYIKKLRQTRSNINGSVTFKALRQS